MEGSAILVDFDGIPGMEIAVADNNGPGNIFGYNVDGSVATDFPIPNPGISGPNSPEVGDVDLDGDLDMAMTMWNGDVVVWDFPRTFDESAIEWGALFHDDWNTNQYGFVVPVPDPASTPTHDPSLAIELGAAYPNPLSGIATIPFALPRAEVIRVTIHDVVGRTLRTLYAGTMAEGTHQLEWDGLEDRGRSVPGGVYYVRIEGLVTGRAWRTITVAH
jgi:hypothetical protein